MGNSESKTTVVSTLKPETSLRSKNPRLVELTDPRSPTCGIDRTPIQVSGAACCVYEESVGFVCVDPRSPTAGILRTPMKDSLQVTVSSLARRLSTLFLNDVLPGDSASVVPFASFTKHSYSASVEQQGELSSKEPLLPSHDSQYSLSTCADSSSTLLDLSSSISYKSFSTTPSVLAGVPQLEVEVGTGASLEEAEEALLLEESPPRRALSLSLLACHEGVYSPNFYSSVEEQHTPSEMEQGGDHTYAFSFDSCKPTESSAPVQGVVMPPPDATRPSELKEVIKRDSSVTEKVLELPEKLSSCQLTSASRKPSSNLHVQSEGCQSGITFPKFDICSPSQVMFKPQWLGVGFGTTGIRARGFQGRGKGPSSPISTCKPVIDENDNRIVLTKQKHRGKALCGEGRSPLQILKETNSPRGHTAQMKLKVSTPEKQRIGQIDRRALVLSLSKENQ